MNRDRKLIILSVLYFAILGCFLLGCSEGTDSSPVSALMTGINSSDGLNSSNIITGKVLNSSTNEIIPNAYVQLYDVQQNFIMGKLTDSDGVYTFNGMDNGTYTLSISKNGYKNFDLTEQNPRECYVCNGKTNPENYILFLSPGSSSSVTATVKGKVVRSDNVSTVNNIVTLYDSSNRPVDTTSVLGDGSFNFYNVPGDNDNHYIISTDNASYPISVNNGSVSPSNISIIINKTNAITGTLLNSSDNQELKNISVKLFKGTTPIKTLRSDENGSFGFTNLDDGNYKISIISEIYEPIDSSIINYTISNGKSSPDSNIIILKSKSGVTNTDTTYASIKGIVNHSNGTIVSSATAILYKKKYGEDPRAIDETTVLGDGSFTFFNVPAGSGYYIAVSDDAINTITRYDIGIDESGTVSPSNIIITINLDSDPDYIATLTFKVVSAYTGAPLELATIKLNNENIGTTNLKGELEANKIALVGYNRIEISKEGFETLTTSKKFTKTVDNPVTFTMIDDTKDGYGSITGRYVDESNGNGLPGKYVRLYRLIERTQSTPIGNKSETWYDVDKKFILTTKTSNGNESNGLAGSFKLTHIEPGIYLIYIGETNAIPPTIQSPHVYDEFDWTQLDENYADKLVITQPLKVVSDQTTYWTNYEQGN